MSEIERLKNEPAQQNALYALPETLQQPGLALLRVPFQGNQISKLPKPTKAQTDAVRADFKAGVRCEICGTWHHPNVVHLDYVGHAALTDRLLDADPLWSWEPLSMGTNGLPLFDSEGGLWIRLTVCGHTRLGYGDSQGKEGPNAIKECIGDALRNAAMRFGAALDLWHKGELHEKPKYADDDAFAASTGYDCTDWLEAIMACTDEAGMSKLAAELRTKPEIPSSAMKKIRQAWVAHNNTIKGKSNA